MYVWRARSSIQSFFWWYPFSFFQYPALHVNTTQHPLHHFFFFLLFSGAPLTSTVFLSRYRRRCRKCEFSGEVGSWDRQKFCLFFFSVCLFNGVNGVCDVFFVARTSKQEDPVEFIWLLWNCFFAPSQNDCIIMCFTVFMEKHFSALTCLLDGLCQHFV